MKASVKCVIERAKEALEGGWIQHRLAEDYDGHAVNARGPFAERFCLIGACYHAGESFAGDCMAEVEAMQYLYRAVRDFYEDAEEARDCRDWLDGLVRFNDARGRTKAEVLAVIDRALEQD